MKIELSVIEFLKQMIDFWIHDPLSGVVLCVALMFLFSGIYQRLDR